MSAWVAEEQEEGFVASLGTLSVRIELPLACPHAVPLSCHTLAQYHHQLVSIQASVKNKPVGQQEFVAYSQARLVCSHCQLPPELATFLQRVEQHLRAFSN